MYLSDRQHIVVHDGAKICSCNMSAGIPQGSKLGPILFIIYLNKIVENIHSQTIVFADDCTLLVSHDDHVQVTRILNKNPESLNQCG